MTGTITGTVTGARSALTAWTADFAAVVARIGPRFARSEARQHAADYLRGLLSRVERKNSWQLAEMVGDAAPYGLLSWPRSSSELVRLTSCVSVPGDAAYYSRRRLAATIPSALHAAVQEGGNCPSPPGRHPPGEALSS